MRRQLVVYLIVLCCAVALLGFCTLNLLGLVNTVDHQVEDTLAQELDITADSILHDAEMPPRGDFRSRKRFLLLWTTFCRHNR